MKQRQTISGDITGASATVFSLNFSSAGKGPCMDGKAKNIYFSPGGGGWGAVVK